MIRITNSNGEDAFIIHDNGDATIHGVLKTNEQLSEEDLKKAFNTKNVKKKRDDE